MMRLAIFASGSGSNAEAIIKAVENKLIDAEVAILISDRADAYALERAKNHNIKCLFVNPKDYSSKHAYEGKLIEVLSVLNIDYVCLAGYMRIVSKTLIEHYPNHIINIHPALLPSFKGAHGIKDAYEFGVKIMGATIHLIDETVDGGIILDQESFHLEENDTLISVENKMHKIEHELYVRVLKKICSTGGKNEKSVN